MKALSITAAFLAICAGPSVAGCAQDAAPCEVAGRSYHIELPQEPAAGNPAVIFMHGYGGSGRGVLRNRRLVQNILDRGYAFVAPNGLPMGNGRRGFRWAFRGPQQAAEFDFITSLRDDLNTRFSVSSDRILLSGFSNGAFMVAYMACENPGSFSGYAAVAGGFWRPEPLNCEGAVDLHMTHGWTDPVVPLEGRILRGTSRDDPGAVVQGDIFRTLEIFREAGSCPRNTPSDFATSGKFQIRRWNGCDDDTGITFALHPGGHNIPQGWATLALDWFEAR